ncbi:MAG: hypothetical protein DWQ01_09295 [Planctomycetota bacterium]|nr:MAG: hypothetical protein DWQ01_09295 [Planctomycetota bacterium]
MQIAAAAVLSSLALSFWLGNGEPEPAETTVTLNPFGTVFTLLAWLLLVAINGWCLYKLLRQPTGRHSELKKDKKSDSGTFSA